MSTASAIKSCTMLAVAGARAPRSRRSKACAKNGELHPMQAAFKEYHGLQCGFCTPGMVMSAIDLVQRTTRSRRSRRSASELEGNICRCTGYHNIVKAIQAGRAPAMKGAQSRHERQRRPASAHRSAARRTTASSPAPGSTPTTSTCRARPTPYFLRSPHAHAQDQRASTRPRPRRRPACVAVFTGDDSRPTRSAGCPAAG